MRKESKKDEYISICMTESLCCTAEINTLEINYTPIKFKKTQNTRSDNVFRSLLSIPQK